MKNVKKILQALALNEATHSHPSSKPHQKGGDVGRNKLAHLQTQLVLQQLRRVRHARTNKVLVDYPGRTVLVRGERKMCLRQSARSRVERQRTHFTPAKILHAEKPCVRWCFCVSAYESLRRVDVAVRAPTTTASAPEHSWPGSVHTQSACPATQLRQSASLIWTDSSLSTPMPTTHHRRCADAGAISRLHLRPLRASAWTRSRACRKILGTTHHCRHLKKENARTSTNGTTPPSQVRFCGVSLQSGQPQSSSR